jgi:FkbM family methyltransferase
MRDTRLSDSKSLDLEKFLNHWTSPLHFGSQGGLGVVIPRVELYAGHAYGDAWVAAAYCGFSSPPNPPIPGEWDHGWNFPKYHPATLLCLHSDGSPLKGGEIRFVGRKDQVTTMERNGFRGAISIGLPITYLQDSLEHSQRIPNSLLVMPPHSTMESEGFTFDVDYIDFINSIRHNFEEIYWCLTGSDFLIGANKIIEAQGFHAVLGAHVDDKNSYYRTAQLMSIFETVTSPVFGSHIPYAAFFGAKVSVAGPYSAELELANKHGYILYQRRPEAINLIMQSQQHFIKSEEYAFLRVAPESARTHLEWGYKSVGADNQLTPKELRSLFRWNWTNRVRFWVKWTLGRCARWITRNLNRQYFKDFLKSITLFGIVLGIRNFRALRKSSNAESGFSHIALKSGRQLIMRNGTSDWRNVYQHFWQMELSNVLPESLTEFIDVGAYCGYATAAVLEKFPNCRVICVEPDSENLTILTSNLSQEPNVHIVHGALWSHNLGVSVIDNSDGKWATQVSDINQPALHDSAPSFTWQELSSLFEKRSKRLVKFDVEGAEGEILSHSGEEIFQDTARFLIEIHTWIPRLSEKVSFELHAALRNRNYTTQWSGEFLVVDTLEGLGSPLDGHSDSSNVFN